MAGRLADELESLHKTAPLESLGSEPTGGYRAVGSGASLLIVLPGLVGPADALAAVADELGGGWRVCFVTYPRVPSLDRLLRWLEALRQREGGRVAHVCGGSFGGLVAQSWLRAYPASVGRLVLSSTGPQDPARAGKNVRAMRWMAHMPMMIWRVFLRAAVRASTSRAEDRTFWREFYGAELRAMTWPDLESRYLVSIDIDRAGPPDAATLASWRGKMLVLGGTRDQIARPAVQQALKSVYPAATFHVFEGAGHAPAMEQPDEWLRVVSGFLREA